jgi:hypothetical protein
VKGVPESKSGINDRRFFLKKERTIEINIPF